MLFFSGRSSPSLFISTLVIFLQSSFNIEKSIQEALVSRIGIAHSDCYGDLLATVEFLLLVGGYRLHILSCSELDVALFEIRKKPLGPTSAVPGDIFESMNASPFFYNDSLR